MRVLVTGADGFVGRRLVARLRARGNEVIAAGHAQLDVGDAAQVHAAVAAAQPTALVHLAAISFVPEAEAGGSLSYRVNYLGTRHLLAAVAEAAQRARVLLVSSGMVYGNAASGDPPFGEQSALRPASAYARSKAAADLLGGVYAARGLSVFRARPWNHTGAGRPDRFVEASFARQLAEIEAGLRPARIETGALDSLRDFLHVEDVVDAYLALLDGDAPAGAYNVASGHPSRIREVLDLLLARSPVRPELVIDPARVRPPDVSVGSAQRLSAATGWAPKRTLDQALAELLEEQRAKIRSRDERFAQRL